MRFQVHEAGASSLLQGHTDLSHVASSATDRSPDVGDEGGLQLEEHRAKIVTEEEEEPPAAKEEVEESSDGGDRDEDVNDADDEDEAAAPSPTLIQNLRVPTEECDSSPDDSRPPFDFDLDRSDPPDSMSEGGGPSPPSSDESPQPETELKPPASAHIPEPSATPEEEERPRLHRFRPVEVFTWDKFVQDETNFQPVIRLSKDIPTEMLDYVNYRSASVRALPGMRTFYEGMIQANTADDEPAAAPIRLFNNIDDEASEFLLFLETGEGSQC